MEQQIQLSLPTDWIELLKRTADSQHTDLITVLRQAVEHYLKEQAHQTIEQEQVAYVAQHAELLRQYAGEYIAMRRGYVIDHDSDRAALSQRVRARYGSTPILITPVLAQPHQTITVHSPRSSHA